MRKRLLVPALLLILTVLASACTSSKTPDKTQPGNTTAPAQEAKKGPNGELYGGTYHLVLREEPPVIDPQIDTTLNVYNMSRNLFNTLLRFKGKTLELEPELLAEMPKAEADNMTYHFKLRNDVKFHNGAQLTAKDVKFTFERMLTKSTKAANTWLLTDIKGAKDMLDGKATELAGFTIKNDFEFDIVLSRPYRPFLQLLAAAPASIFPAEYTKQVGDQFGRKPVGTGPFKVGTWNANSLIVLEKNPDYFEKGLPYLDKVEYKIVPEEATRWLEFEGGNVDETTPPSAQYTNAKTSGKYAFIEYTTLNTFYIALNQKNFTNPKVREAISLAIDREKFLATIYNGQGKVAKQFVTPGIPGALASPAGFKYDPARAKQLLKEAGAENLKIEAWQRGTDKVSDGNLAIQQMLKEVGINWEVKMVDRASFNQARSQGTIPANFGNWFADYPDPDNYLYTYFHSSQSKGMSVNYNSADLDKALDEARGMTDQAKREKMYQDVETKLLAEFAIIPIFHQSGYTVTQKWVHGIVGAPTEVEGQKLIWKDAGK